MGSGRAAVGSLRLPRKRAVACPGVSAPNGRLVGSCRVPDSAPVRSVYPSAHVRFGLWIQPESKEPKKKDVDGIHL